MTLRIGLIGCGGITHAHVEGWRAIASRAEIVSVADVSEENANRRVAQVGYPVTLYADATSWPTVVSTQWILRCPITCIAMRSWLLHRRAST